MTSTRRRLAVLTTSTLVVGAFAGPALAGTTMRAGCTVADDTYSFSSPDEVTHVYPGSDKGMTVNPAGEILSGRVSSGADSCGIDGAFTDEILVLGGTSGKTTGQTVRLAATLRFDGDVSVAGAGETYSAIAEVLARFSVEGQQATGEAGDIRAASEVRLSMQNSAFPGTQLSAPFTESWKHRGGGVQLGEYEQSEGGSTRDLATGWQTVYFDAKVGERLDVDMHLNLFADGDQSSSGTADVDRFEVHVAPVDTGVVLDRGDAQPEPEPEPEPTPAELVAQARQQLAGYTVQHGVKHALDVKLAHAARALSAGQDACGHLASFLAQTSAQSGKKLTATQAAALTSTVGQARTGLSC